MREDFRVTMTWIQGYRCIVGIFILSCDSDFSYFMLVMLHMQICNYSVMFTIIMIYLQNYVLTNDSQHYHIYNVKKSTFVLKFRITKKTTIYRVCVLTEYTRNKVSLAYININFPLQFKKCTYIVHLENAALWLADKNFCDYLDFLVQKK